MEADQIHTILQKVMDCDPFVKSNLMLSSNFKRKKYYKKQFHYINPISVNIDKNKKTVFFLFANN